MKPITCILTHSTCYRGTTRGRPVGVLWHDTGAGNPWLKRYVQPWEGEADYDRLIALLGKNQYGNDWNHVEIQKGVNAFIGKLADGSVAAVQTLGWLQRPWGCGTGRYGSCNGSPEVERSPFWIQFEICDDRCRSAEYFRDVYREGVALTAYLCKKYDIDPNGTVTYAGQRVPTVLCHHDSWTYGLGSDHADVLTWFGKYGKTMADVRADVKTELEGKDMTEAETRELVQKLLAPYAKTAEVEAKLKRFAQTATVEKLLRDYATPAEVSRRIEAAKRMIPDLADAPAWMRPELKTLLEVGAINGGTEGKPDDVNLPFETARAAVIAKRYTDAFLKKEDR